MGNLLRLEPWDGTISPHYPLARARGDASSAQHAATAIGLLEENGRNRQAQGPLYAVRLAYSCNQQAPGLATLGHHRCRWTCLTFDLLDIQPEGFRTRIRRSQAQLEQIRLVPPAADCARYHPCVSGARTCRRTSWHRRWAQGAARRWRRPPV